MDLATKTIRALRRGASRLAPALVFATLSPCAGGRGAATPPDTHAPFSYESVQVADGVHAFIEPTNHAIVSGNVIAVIGDEAALVFDTGHHPPMTRAIVRDLKRITAKPVRFVVVSHWHDDHWVGNAEFAAAYPGAQVIAHPFTAARMEQRKQEFRGEPCKALLRSQAQPIRDQLASGKKRDGSPLPADIRAAEEAMIAKADEQLRECDMMQFRGVDRHVERSLELDLGGRTVRLMHLGRGNTAGDLVAYVPDSRTLLAGDLLVHPLPFATQVYVREWAAVLRALAALDAAAIVPGHGPVMRDHAYLEQLTALLESLDAQARAAYRPRMTADELRERIDLSSFRAEFCGDDAIRGLNFDAMIRGSAVDRAWQDLSGQWQPEG